MSGASLNPRDEAIVRIVHARGTVNLSVLLTDFRARPMCAKTARSALARLVASGWLVRSGRQSALWSISPAALPHLAEDTPGAPLPAEPSAAPAPQPDTRSPLCRQAYQPAHFASARPGASDFLAIRSRGPFH